MNLVVGAQLGFPQMANLIWHASLKEYSRARAYSDFILNLCITDTMYLEKVMSVRKPGGGLTGFLSEADLGVLRYPCL